METYFQALLLAQRNVAAKTLQPSPAVQDVLNQLNDRYHQCLVSLRVRFGVWEGRRLRMGAP